MSSNEEYLDGLLKSVTKEESQKENSFSTDDLSRMLDQLEDLEVVPPTLEVQPKNALKDLSVENTNENNSNGSEMQDSEMQDSEIQDSEIENSEMQDSEIEDSEIENSEIEDSETNDDVSLEELLANVELNTQESNFSNPSEFDNDALMEVNNQELFTSDYPVENNDALSEMDALLADLTSTNSEISELLGTSPDVKSEVVDDKKKKKPKKEKKGKKNIEYVDLTENIENSASSEIDLLFQDSEDIQVDEVKKTNEKKNFIHRIGELLFAEDENEEVLEAEKKVKPEKKKKENKKDKSKAAANNDNPDAEESTENSKGKKDEKKEKVKKVKKEKVPHKSDGIKIPTSRFIKTFLICFSILAVIMVISVFAPKKLEIVMAKDAYYIQDYNTAFKLLDGKKLNSNDQIIYARTFIILQIQRKIDSYYNYLAMNKPLEALDALMQGIEKYDEIKEDAGLYNVTPQIEELYLSILALLSDNYQLTEQDAREIILYEYDWVYSKRLESIVYGTEFINPYEQAAEVPIEEVTTKPELEDMLPEEMDMLEE